MAPEPGRRRLSTDVGCRLEGDRGMQPAIDGLQFGSTDSIGLPRCIDDQFAEWNGAEKTRTASMNPAINPRCSQNPISMNDRSAPFFFQKG